MKLSMLIVPVLLLGIHALPAQAKYPKVAPAGEVIKSWKDYEANETDARPAMEFPFQTCFEATAKRYDIPVTLLLALARGESNFNPDARSSANARGLMQILWPGTAKELGIHSLSRLLDPCTNIDAGARYLKKLLKRYKGNIHLSLAAYNYGPGAIKRDGSRVPDGAAWYSGYILRHLSYVLGRSPRTGRKVPVPKKYEDDHRFEILVFHKPYRAEAFVRGIESRLKNVRLSWFDVGFGRYQVDLMYQNQAELKRGKAELRRWGFL